MERAGAAVVIPDSELTAARLAHEVGGLLADRGTIGVDGAGVGWPRPARLGARGRRGAAGGSWVGRESLRRER